MRWFWDSDARHPTEACGIKNAVVFLVLARSASFGCMRKWGRKEGPRSVVIESNRIRLAYRSVCRVVAFGCQLIAVQLHLFLRESSEVIEMTGF